MFKAYFLVALLFAACSPRSTFPTAPAGLTASDSDSGKGG